VDESFQSFTCTGTDNLTRTTKTQNTQITQNSTTQKGAIVNSATDTLRKPRLRERTDRAWFGRLVRHLARKRRTVWVYSYNSWAHTGLMLNVALNKCLIANVTWRL